MFLSVIIASLRWRTSSGFLSNECLSTYSARSLKLLLDDENGHRMANYFVCGNSKHSNLHPSLSFHRAHFFAGLSFRYQANPNPKEGLQTRNARARSLQRISILRVPAEISRIICIICTISNHETSHSRKDYVLTERGHRSATRHYYYYYRESPECRNFFPVCSLLLLQSALSSGSFAILSNPSASPWSSRRLGGR